MSDLIRGTRIAFCAIFISSFGFAADAFDFDGAWTGDAANCSKVFVKRHNRLLITRNSDSFGGGFVVNGNLIRGPFLTCKIDKRNQDGAVLNLLASCTSMIAPLSPMQFTVRFENDDKITRIFSSFPELATSYERCKF